MVYGDDAVVELFCFLYVSNV